MPDPESGGPVRRFFRGIGFVLRGQRMALGSPRLRLLSIFATLTAAVLYTGPLVLLSLALFLLEWELHPSWRLTGSGEELAIEGGKEALVVIAIALYALVSFVLSVVVGRVILGFFCDALAERTESLLTDKSAPTRSWWTALKDALRETFVQALLLGIHIPTLALVALVAWFSHPIALVLAWWWGALWLTITFTSSVSATHGLGVHQRLRTLLKHKALSLGFGAVPALMMPVLVPLFLPGMVVGGTKLFLSLAAHDEAPSDLTDDEKAKLRA